MSKRYYVYMMSNVSNSVIYTGVTNDLNRRFYEHSTGAGSEFVKKYRLNKVVYYEEYSAPYDAISREKQIKAGSRKKKVDLVNSTNPNWKHVEIG